MKRLHRMGWGRLRWWGLLGVVLGILAGVWWWNTPRTLRVVARFSAFPPDGYNDGWNNITVVTPGGLVIDETDQRGHRWRFNLHAERWVSLHDWEGRLRWRVSLPPLWPFAVSPDGRILVALGTGKQPGVWDAPYFWRDGQPIGMHLPPPLEIAKAQHAYGMVAGGGGVDISGHPSHLVVTNMGRAWIIRRDDPTAEITVVDAYGIVATGYYDKPLGWSSQNTPQLEGLCRYIALDGSALVTQKVDQKGIPKLEYASLAVHERQVVVTPRYLVQQEASKLDEQGRLYCQSGDIYGPQGRLFKQSLYPGSHFFGPSWQDFSPIYCTDQGSSIIHQNILSTWYIPQQVNRKRITASTDGQYALAYGAWDSSMPPILRYVSSNVPRFGELWRQYHSSSSRLAIYQAPGRLRAFLDIPVGNKVWAPLFTTGNSFEGLFLSPNGRRAVLQSFGKGERREFIVLGW